MKKMIALLLALACVLALVGCGQNEDPTTPTGYPTGKIQQPQIMYNGQVYFYFATGFDEPLPDGYELVGSISAVDNDNEPKEDFHGARVELEQEVYASASNAETIYVKYEKGYAQFAVKEIEVTTPTGNIEETTDTENNENISTETTIDWSEIPGGKRFIIQIRDRTVEEQLPCADAEELFYEDETAKYYFNVIKSQYIEVIYNNGNSEDIVTALNAGRATIADLDEFGIEYHTEPKQ